MNSKRPNIILIMTDQQRADTINALGYSHMMTPNLDKLANNGLSFTNAYCCGATCIASRAALFTGMYPHNTGVYSFNNWSHIRSWVHDLADNGYHCVNIGKMHIQPIFDNYAFHERVVVENPTYDYPKYMGRDDEWGRYLGLHGKQRPLDRHLSDPQWRLKYQSIPWPMDEHLHPDIFIGESACGWINSYKQDKSIFLQIGFTGPHETYDPIPRHLELYVDKDIPKPALQYGELDNKPPQHKAHRDFNNRFNHESQIAMPEATENDIIRMRRHYYAKVTTIDEKIGHIMELLEMKGYLDNALVIFTSDHGDMLGDHGLPYKWLMYDSVVNIPLIIWDTRKRVTRKIHDLVSHMDIGPTILEAAGIEVPQYLEGNSLIGYIENSTVKKHDYVFCEDNYLTMIRNEKYKMVYYTGQDNNGELYDLEKDPNEFNNLFQDVTYSKVKEEIKQSLLSWLLFSNYKTSGYKNLENNRTLIMPHDSFYLHPAPKNNPEGWFVMNSQF